MSDKLKRILIIVLMLAILAYTFINYTNGGIDKTTLLMLVVFMGWLLISQVSALIREWNDT